MSDRAALLGQQRPDGAGGMQPVEDSQRPQLLAGLKRAHPADFEMDDASRLRWHRQQAGAAESAMDWDAAVFHWERAGAGKSENRNSKPERNPNPEARISHFESEVRDLKFEISIEARLAYAREAAGVVQRAAKEERSRWSVILPRPPWAKPEMLDLSSSYARGLGDAVSKERGAATFHCYRTFNTSWCMDHIHINNDKPIKPWQKENH